MADEASRTIVGVVLCGGAGVRIGGRKAMQRLAGRPLAAHVADVLRPGVTTLAVSGDAEAAAELGVDNLEDAQGVVRGPLAGVLAGLEWAAARGAGWLATAPCDAPLLPPGLVSRLASAPADAAYAATADGRHPLVSIWRVTLAQRLREALKVDHPPVWGLLDALGAKQVWFDDAGAFMNVNTPAELRLAEARLARL